MRYDHAPNLDPGKTRVMRGIAVLACVVGCVAPSTSGTLLRWESSPEQLHVYAALVGTAPDELSEQIESMNLRDLLPTPPDPLDKDGKAFYLGLQKSIRELRLSQDLPSVLTLEHDREDSLQLTLRGAEPGPAPPASASTLEKQEYRFRLRESKMFQLRARLSSSGDVQSFYLTQGQKNIPQLIFQLPRGRVEVGDRWPLDAQLLTVDSRYTHDRSSRSSWAQLVQLDAGANGEGVAGITFFAAESFEGRADLPDSSAAAPFRLESTYVAYGELSLETGRWKRYLGELTQRSDGMRPTATLSRSVHFLQQL